MRKAKFWLILAGIILTVAVVAAGAVRSFSKASIEVKTAVAEERTFEDKVLVSGKVDATHKVDVVAPFAAKLLTLKVKEGDRVVSGQLLAEMDASDAEDRAKEAEAALAVAEAQLAQALKPARTEELSQAEAALEAAEAQAEASRKDLERQRLLFEQEAVSQAELEAAETAYTRAKSDADAAAARLAALKNPDDNQIRILQAQVEQARLAAQNARRAASKGRLTASADGVVLYTSSRAGSYLQPGAPILTFGDLKKLEVVADLSEQDIGGIAAGQLAEITWAGQPDKTLKGKVSRVAPAVTKTGDRETENAVRVFVELPQNNLLPGATVDVLIYRVKPFKAVMIPNEAILTEGKSKFVFVVEKRTARKHKVELGLANELSTVIKAGIRPGDRVILNPKDIKDGRPVRVTGGAKK
ncbi:MAG: efflux RND transporter periplasmic adaptor subunit [Bacillota bacterium]